MKGCVWVITAENLCFSYTGSAPYLLSQVNLEIRDGEYVSVLGENGSGKSTLMRLILKFLKPTKGNIATNAVRIGYVPQKADYLNSSFPITVLEMLHSYRKLLKVKDREIVGKNLKKVGMTGFEGALVGTLSGGQAQKVRIARTLIGDPDLLILDEPSTGVDPGSQKEIYGFLKKLNQENGITIVSVEHNLDAAIANSTLIYHLSEGHGHLCSTEQYAREYLKADGKDET